MGKNSAIAWTDHTWNPWQGCHKVSDGCLNCYMFRDMKRFGKVPSLVLRSIDSTFNAPMKWKELARVFVCSWSDFFIQEADRWRDSAWEIIRKTPHLTYQILTKRPERIKDCLPEDWGQGWPNVWLGVTTENQAMANLRVPALLKIPAAIHFVSVEPMLEVVNLANVIMPDGDHLGNNLFNHGTGNGINWVICGGESGPKARPMHPDWVRGLRNQCQGARVPFFFKQWGEWLPAGQRANGCDELPESTKYHDFGDGRGICARVGKKAAGHYLDGIEWHQFPK